MILHHGEVALLTCPMHRPMTNYGAGMQGLYIQALCIDGDVGRRWRSCISEVGKAKEKLLPRWHEVALPETCNTLI